MAKYYNPEYYQRNKERIKAKSVKWGRSEKGKEYFRQHYLQNIDYYKQNQRRYHNKLKEETLKYYGNGKYACVKCGESRMACLSIDHIKNIGNKKRQSLGRSGYLFYLWLKRHGYPEGYQTLCMNCQYVKAFEDNEWGYSNALSP